MSRHKSVSTEKMRAWQSRRKGPSSGMIGTLRYLNNESYRKYRANKKKIAWIEQAVREFHGE